MKRYKCLVEDYNVLGGCLKGVIYNEDHTWGRKYITIKDFAEMFPNDWELVEEFTLPEKWCIKGCGEMENWQKEYMYDKANVAFSYPDSWYLTDDTKLLYWGLYNNKPSGYTEITFKQFEKYVLMKDTKEIIGYKLKEDCKQYNIAAAKIEGYAQCGVANVSTKVFYINENRSAINAWTNANVLDLWFEPVYKETKTLPKINGYKGEITQISGIVNYGCAQLSSKGIESFLKNRGIGVNREINSITLESGVEITIEQLQQIVDYFKD